MCGLLVRMQNSKDAERLVEASRTVCICGTFPRIVFSHKAEKARKDKRCTARSASREHRASSGRERKRSMSDSRSTSRTRTRSKLRKSYQSKSPSERARLPGEKQYAQAHNTTVSDSYTAFHNELLIYTLPLSVRNLLSLELISNLITVKSLHVITCYLNFLQVSSAAAKADAYTVLSNFGKVVDISIEGKLVKKYKLHFSNTDC